MSWYNKYIDFSEDMKRPVISDNGYDVHKVIDQIESGFLPQEVVQRHCDVKKERSSNCVPVSMNIVHVEAAIEFARDNTELIDEIREEQEILIKSLVSPPENAKERIKNQEFTYFDIIELENNDGTVKIRYE